MSIKSQLTEMRELVDQALVDAEKADLGRGQPGTRVRKVMQSVKKLAQAVRVEVAETRRAARDGDT